MKKTYVATMPDHVGAFLEASRRIGALGGEEVGPGHHLWMLLEQGATLPLRHAAPHAELHLVVQGVGAAFGDHRTVPADDCGLALSGSAHEEFIGIRTAAAGLGHPRDAGFGFRALDGGLNGCCACPTRCGPST